MGSSTSTALIKTEAKEAFKNALTIGKKYATEFAQSDRFLRPLILAEGISAVKESLTDEAMSAFMALSGSRLGFQTDRDENGRTTYPVGVVRVVLIEAMFREVEVVGNEFNIIGGNFFCTAEGWERRLRNIGCRRFLTPIGPAEDPVISSPNQKGFSKITASFCASASCVKDGKEYQVAFTSGHGGVDGRIQVSAFARDISDALSGLKGKVRARLLKALYSYVADVPDSDDEDDILSSVVQVPVNAIDNKPIEELPPVAEVKLSAKYHSAIEAVNKAADRAAIEKVAKYADKLHADGTMPEHERTLLQAVIEARWDEVPEAA